MELDLLAHPMGILDGEGILRVLDGAERIVCSGEVREASFFECPGLRSYHYLSVNGYTMATTVSYGALVLWNPDNSEDAPFDTAEAITALTLRYHQRRSGYVGTGIEHYTRACDMAAAVVDGAYLAVYRLADTFHLATGLRSQDRSDALRAAHERAQLPYCNLRDYLHDDRRVPYLIACLAADRFTHHFNDWYHPLFSHA